MSGQQATLRPGRWGPIRWPGLPADPGRQLNRWLAGLGVFGVTAVAVALLGIAGSGATVAAGALCSGASAAASGALMVLAGRRLDRLAFRVVLGLAVLVWSVGQLWNGVAVAVGTPSFPTPGDIISLCAAPLGVLGVLMVPRSATGPHPTWRIGLDTGLLGVSLALPVWHFLFAGVLRDRGAAVPDAVAVVVLLADILIACLGALAYLRDLDRNLLLLCLGASCYAVGDLITLHSSIVQPGQWPWPGAALWCLAWPLIAAGVLRYRPTPPPADRPLLAVDPDARSVLVTTTVSLMVLLVSVVALITEHRPEGVSIGLVIVAAVLFWGRELLNSRFRAGLLSRLHQEATEDPLTGLANRRALAARMAALPAGEPWCLLTVDLDGFKDVNDLLGHSTGDKLLAAVGGRLEAAAPAGALVGRIGGDEFVVLMPGGLAAGEAVGDAVVSAVRESAADVAGVSRVEVSASVGVAAVPPGDAGTDRSPVPGTGVRSDSGTGSAPGSGPGSGRRSDGHSHNQSLNHSHPHAHGAELPALDPLGALSASAAALRAAKAGGRNQVEVYDRAVALARQRRLRIEERLRLAVENGSIRVMFQPIVDLRRGVLAGAEALARWEDPELGPVDPAEFIPVAEQTGLVVALGEKVLHETLRAAVDDGLGARGLRLSCNVSPVQLRVAGFHRMVAEAMVAHGMTDPNLVIEVTEQVLVEEGLAVETLQRLADLGVTIAIDDFGTGYSALGYLQRLPAEVLKIDRSLTSSLVVQPRSRAITRAVLDLGRTVGLSVVVEGVDTEQVADLVRRMGAGFAQGSYYGPAMTPPELAAMADRLSLEARGSATTARP